RGQGGFAAAADHRHGLVPLDGAKRVADRMPAGRARRDDRDIRAFGAVGDADGAGGHVDDDHRREERADTAGAALEQHPVLLLPGARPADPRPDDHAHSIGVSRGDGEARVVQRQPGRRQRELDESVVAADLLAVHELRGVESRDLARDLRVIRRGIERGDPPDPRAAFHQPGPEGVLAGADRGDDTEPGQGNAFAHAVGPRVPGGRAYSVGASTWLSMYFAASPTVAIFSASSSGISRSNSSSNAMTSSTTSSESAPRSSTNFDWGVTSPASTPSCSTTIAFTRSNTGAAIAHPPPDLSPHYQSAVHVQDLTRDVTGFFRGEKGHGGRHFLGAAGAAHRDVIDEPGALVLPERRRQPGFDVSRGDGIDRDAAAGDFLRHGLGEPDDRGLRRDVVRLARIPDLGDDGADVDDPPPPLAEHLPQAGPGEIERRVQVDRHDVVPVFVPHPDQEPVPGQPRVVDHDVQAAAPFSRRVDRPPALVGAGDIGLQHLRGSAGLLNAFPGALRRPGVLMIVDHDAGAFAGQPDRDRRPDPPGGSRDEGDALGEAHRTCWPKIALRASSRDATSSTWQGTTGTVLRIIPESVVPGPISTNCRAPISYMTRIDCSHSTAEVTWS